MISVNIKNRYNQVILLIILIPNHQFFNIMIFNQQFLNLKLEIILNFVQVITLPKNEKKYYTGN